MKNFVAIFIYIMLNIVDFVLLLVGAIVSVCGNITIGIILMVLGIIGLGFRSFGW